MTILQLIALKPLNTTISLGLPVLMHVWPDRSFLSKTTESASGRTQNKERKREESKNKRTMDNKCESDPNCWDAHGAGGWFRHKGRNESKNFSPGFKALGKSTGETLQLLRSNMEEMSVERFRMSGTVSFPIKLQNSALNMEKHAGRNIVMPYDLIWTRGKL